MKSLVLAYILSGEKPDNRTSIAKVKFFLYCSIYLDEKLFLGIYYLTFHLANFFGPSLTWLTINEFFYYYYGIVLIVDLDSDSGWRGKS